MATTRFPNGITNANTKSALSTYIDADPTKAHAYFNDFDTYAAGDWTVTVTGSGAVTQAANDGGTIVLTTSGTSGDNVFLQLNAASFSPDTTRRMWFKARMAVDNIATVQLFAGLQNTTTTPLTATDGIYFIKPNAQASLDVIVRKDATTGSTSQTQQVALANATFVDIGWYYDSKLGLAFYANGVQIGSFADVTAYFPDAILTPSFGIQTGAAATRALTVDYIFGSKDREGPKNV